jgi:hypothetical protein
VGRASFMEHVALELIEPITAFVGDVLDAELTRCGKFS